MTSDLLLLLQCPTGQCSDLQADMHEVAQHTSDKAQHGPLNTRGVKDPIPLEAAHFLEIPARNLFLNV